MSVTSDERSSCCRPLISSTINEYSGRRPRNTWSLMSSSDIPNCSAIPSLRRAYSLTGSPLSCTHCCSSSMRTPIFRLCVCAARNRGFHSSYLSSCAPWLRCHNLADPANLDISISLVCASDQRPISLAISNRRIHSSAITSPLPENSSNRSADRISPATR